MSARLECRDLLFSFVAIVNSTVLRTEKWVKWVDLTLCSEHPYTHTHTHTKTPFSVIPFTQKRSRTCRSPERKRNPVVPRA